MAVKGEIETETSSIDTHREKDESVFDGSSMLVDKGVGNCKREATSTQSGITTT